MGYVPLPLRSFRDKPMPNLPGDICYDTDTKKFFVWTNGKWDEVINAAPLTESFDFDAHGVPVQDRPYPYYERWDIDE